MRNLRMKIRDTRFPGIASFVRFSRSCRSIFNNLSFLSARFITLQHENHDRILAGTSQSGIGVSTTGEFAYENFIVRSCLEKFNIPRFGFIVFKFYYG